MRMIRMIAIAFSLLFVGAAAAIAGPVDVVAAANTARLQDCAGSSKAARPLRAQAELQEAARLLAGGAGLEAAVSASGYRAKKSASIALRNGVDEGRIRALLAQRFCRTVSDPDLLEIGAYQRETDTWIVLAEPFAPPTPGDASIASRVLDLVNEARAEARRCGRKKFPATAPLRMADALGRAAQAHARDMAGHDFLDHEGTDGSAPAGRATRVGYAWRLVAENVAAGQASPEEAVATWLASPGHCANIMDAGYTDTGIGYAVNMAGDRGTYWVQMFGTTR